MTTTEPDIIERLRSEISCWPDLAREAASEIERLRDEVRILTARNTPPSCKDCGDWLHLGDCTS